MENSSASIRLFLAVTSMIAALMVCTLAGAAEGNGTVSSLGESNSYAADNSRDNRSGNGSHDVGLILSLTRSLSLDLRLGPVDTGKAPIDQKQLGAPPIPITKTPGSDLRYSRLGVGFTLGF